MKDIHPVTARARRRSALLLALALVLLAGLLAALAAAGGSQPQPPLPSETPVTCADISHGTGPSYYLCSG